MNQSIHFNRLWVSVADGIDYYEVGGDYRKLGHIAAQPVQKLPLSGWRTKDRKYLVSCSWYRWQVIQVEPGPPRVVFERRPYHPGARIIGGWLDFKSKGLYVVEQLEGPPKALPRKLVEWGLDREPAVRWVTTLPADVSESGGQVVLAGRLDNRRHLAVLSGLTRIALVDVADPWHPLTSDVVSDGGAAIAVERAVLYNQGGGEDKTSWLDAYDVSSPRSVRLAERLPVSGWWGDQPNIAAATVGGRTLIVTQRVTGDMVEPISIFEDVGPQPEPTPRLRLIAEHRPITPYGDVSVWTVDVVGTTGYLLGVPPGSGGTVYPHVVELDLTQPQASPKIAKLS